MIGRLPFWRIGSWLGCVAALVEILIKMCLDWANGNGSRREKMTVRLLDFGPSGRRWFVPRFVQGQCRGVGPCGFASIDGFSSLKDAHETAFSSIDLVKAY